MRYLAAFAIFIVAACLSSGAFAHAALVSTDPAAGSVLVRAPERIELRFNEAVAPGAISLIDAEGRARDDAGVTAAGERIMVAVPQPMPRGTTIVSYRVVSQDGHPVSGSLVFSIGAPSATALPSRADGFASGLIWLARLGLYVGLFVGIGGAFLASWVDSSRAGLGVIVAALLVGLLGALASLGLQGVDLLGLAPSALLAPEPWQIALTTSAGPTLLIAAAAMLTGMVALYAGASAGRALSALAFAGVGIVLAASGHAATAPPQWLTRSAVFIHGIGVAFWVGALVPLAVLAARSKPHTVVVMRRFSALALPLVALLALAGLMLAAVQLRGLSSLIETSYGLILLTKLALVVVLFALAALNRFKLVPMLAIDAAAARPLQRSILAECVAAIAILAVVAGWRFTPPPRSLTPEAPLAIHIHGEKAMFQVLASPGAPGSNDFVLQLMAEDGTLLAAKEASLTLSLPERGIEPMEHAASLGPDGYWHARGVPIPFAGHWHIRIDALVTDFEKITLEDELNMTP